MASCIARFDNYKVTDLQKESTLRTQMEQVLITKVADFSKLIMLSFFWC